MDGSSRRGPDMTGVRPSRPICINVANQAGAVPYGVTSLFRRVWNLSPGVRGELTGNLITIPPTDPKHREVRTMPKCVACGAELAPPVRVPHTVYVKTLYRIAGQDYCRHHIIRAALAAGVIAEVKPGAGPVAVIPGEAHSAEHDRFHQR